MTIGDCKDNLSGLFHGGNIDTITGLDMVFERSANTLLSKIDPIDTERVAALASTIHDDIFNYALPSDFRKLIDIYPQDNRNSGDTAQRIYAGNFDLNKLISEKNISIESSEGSKFLRINWRSRQSKTIHTMNDVDANGTWSAVGTASGIAESTIFKVSGNASIEFNIVTTSDGIKNTTMDAVDLTDEDEVADFFVWVYFGTAPTSVSAKWGNDLTTNYWSSTAQTTQADGSAFKVGWNLIKFPWSTATETGTVAPSTIDSFQITVASSAQNNVRVDNITCSIGRNFDIKYYSKYLIKNTSGTWLSRYTSDSDIVVLDNDAIQIFHLENLIGISQQAMNPSLDSDILWAKKELLGEDLRDKTGLYAKYRNEHPSQSKKAIAAYGSNPARGRW